MVELLVVLAVIGLLAALLTGAVTKARESARMSLCQNQLRQAGEGLYLHAQRSPGGQLCSGLFDHSREGCMDRHGWVADQMRFGTMAPETLLCPSNPIQVNEKLLDAYGVVTNDNLNDPTGASKSRLTDGICGRSDWRGISGTGAAAAGFARTDPRTSERRDLVSRYFIGQGFNTNYATGWFLTYTAPRVRYQPSDGTLRTNGQAAQQGLRGKRETLGPLTTAYLDVCDVPSSNVALLADAAPGDIDEAIAPVTFAIRPEGTFSRGDPSDRVFAAIGTLLCESASEGPAYYQPSSRKIKRIGSYNSRLDVQWRCELNQTCQPPTGGSGNKMYLQSTLAWIGTHTGAGGFAVNLLFADGSVRTFTDLNDDLFLNPGFPVPDHLSSAEHDRTGYRGRAVELPKTSFFSGVFLAPRTIKGQFE
jgi:prepilin-type processing-associated H-X9-DG protein